MYRMVDGRPVGLYTIRNKHGMVVKIVAHEGTERNVVAQLSAHGRNQVMQPRVGFDGAQRRDVDASVRTHSSEIVAPQINQHDVFGALFRIGQQFLLQQRVFGRGGAAPPCARDRPDGSRPPFQAN